MSSWRFCFSRDNLFLLISFTTMLLIFFVASFSPGDRLWGFNQWGRFPTLLRLITFSLSVIAGLLIITLQRYNSRKNEASLPADGNNLGFIILSISIVAVLGGLFVLFRTRTHFLGDGYTALSLLADDNPLIKPRQLGESYLHVWVKDLIGGDSRSAALLSFQFISVVSGVLFASVTFVFTRLFFESPGKRIAFATGLLSAGFMLLFFGYVENYSVFVLSVLSFALIGIMITSQKISKWTIVPFLLISIFLHVFGVTLIPAAVYLLLLHSRIGNWFSHLPSKTAVMIVSLISIAMLVLLLYIRGISFFFRFALIPITVDRFTVDGYTIFSFPHVLDYLNLLLVLLPGLPIAVMLIAKNRRFNMFRTDAVKFQVILVLSTLGATFIFDPKLGMARDWDLFAFAGVPLATLSAYLLVENTSSAFSGLRTALLVSVLGVTVLIPRVAISVSPDLGVKQFKDYLHLDVRKGRPGWLVLMDYYKTEGLEPEADRSRSEWYRLIPSEAMLDEAMKLMRQGDIYSAMPLLQEAIELNPMNWNIWSNIGICQYRMGNYDEAIRCFGVSDGMNPYSTQASNFLARAYFSKNDLERAEQSWKRSLKIDGEQMEPCLGLLQLYRRQGKRTEWLYYLKKVAKQPEAPPDILVALAVEYLSSGAADSAVTCIKKALDRGIDSARINELVLQYPILRRLLGE